MQKDVFFSYSWKDIPIAMRIYADLVRNGLSVWRDEFSADPGKVYKTEIDNALQSCSGIVILDSPNSRRSKYVQEECSILSTGEEWRTGQKKIAVCLIGDFIATRAESELFQGHNNVKHIDFSKCDQLFDNDKSYLRAITELCSLFGMDFRSAYPDTSEKDFEDELSKYAIKDITRTILIREFELIQLRITKGIPGTERRLEFFNRECEELKIYCPSPLLQLGIELAKSEQYAHARNILNVYTQMYSDDPRGWRAFALVLFELEEYEMTLLAYDKAIELIEAIKAMEPGTITTIRFNSRKNLEYFTISRINRATTLFKMSRYNEAVTEYENIYAEMNPASELLPEHYLLLIDVYDELNDKKQQRKWIDRGLAYHRKDAQLNLAKARWLYEMNSLVEAAAYYRYLVQREIQDLVVMAEYLSVLKCLDYTAEFYRAFAGTREMKRLSDCDDYYYGYILFLAGRVEEAKAYYRKSMCDNKPWYDKIWKIA